jgi:RIO-like serine/threonine protein kinase
MIQKGSWIKADIYRIEGPDGEVVVKDFAAKCRLVRWIGRFQISRECMAYEALQGAEGVLRFLGRIDAHALALERIEGMALGRCGKMNGRRDMLPAVRRVVDVIHGRGVIHNDLRGRDNILVCEDGRVVLLDFAGAFCFRPGSFWHRSLYRILACVDEAAFLKWKTILDPDALTADERIFLRRFARIRRFWLFNPKGALRLR